MRKGSKKEKTEASTSYVQAATTTDGFAAIAFPGRPLTLLGSHQGDHVSPYKLITYALLLKIVQLTTLLDEQLVLLIISSKMMLNR